MANEKSKEVKMNAQNGQNGEKLSYEQLEQIAGNLNKQCQQFYSQLQEANRVISEFNEIGMLLSILERSDYFSGTFVERCSNKIEELVNKALDNAEKTEDESKDKK